MNIPNKITLLRIALVPFFLLAFTSSLSCRYFIALGIFALASITDAIDGHLARKYNLVTTFGKFLDPVADKMLVTAGLLAFLDAHLCNIWIAMLILIREFLISAFRMIAAAQNVLIPANIFGKIKTAMQMASFFIILLLLSIGTLVSVPFNIAIVSNILLGASALMGVISAVIYLKRGCEVLDITK